MADDGPQAASSKRGGLPAPEGDTEPNMLLQKLKSSISKNIQTKVDSILQDVQRFSDNDKLYLYLQLPSGPNAGEKSSSDSSSFSTADQLHTCNWIRSHLEEHADTCLPKQDVYETYRKHCENLQYRALSAANFGKIIRDIFPNIKARRLGGRGQSKYCYSGIRRKTVLNMPLLPNLDLKNDPSELTELVQTYNQEVTEAACELICDWAEKILKRSFDTVVEIARFLVQEHIVNPRCSQAELITSAALAGGPAKPFKAMKGQLPSRSSGTEGEGSGPEAKDRDGGERAVPGKQPSGDKAGKGSEGSKAAGRDSQVEAVMKRFPQLLPRAPALEKTHLTVRSSPPALAPKEPGGVNLTLPIAMATLPPQQAAPLPVFNMFLPPAAVRLPYPEKEKPAGAPAAPAPGAEAGQPPPAQPPTGGVIQKALPAAQPPPPVTDILEIVIQDQEGGVLTTLPPGLEVQGQPLHHGVELAAETAQEPGGHLLQVYPPGAGAHPLQEGPQAPLGLHGAGEPLRGVQLGQGWEDSRAKVEVIRRAPLAREEGAGPGVQGQVLASLLEEKQKQEIGLVEAAQTAAAGIGCSFPVPASATQQELPRLPTPPSLLSNQAPSEG
nr:PREDICTED: DNA-binding protein RFX5 [Lepisosteus oculatus]